MKNLPSASGALADCKIFCLPSANEKFADGECLAGRRQISLPINGKFKICHREIFYLPTGNSFSFLAGNFSPHAGLLRWLAPAPQAVKF